MLVELRLRDLGLISEAHVEFGPGLNVVTGETGVGKTLLITSLGLLSGARGHARLVSSGAAEAVVEAVVEPPAPVRAKLTELGIEPGEEIVWVRRLGADGRSRAWIEGQLVPIGAISELGEHLIELHGQGAGFALARPAAQLEALDLLGSNVELLARYREALHRLRSLERDLDALETDDRTRARELDMLAYQAGEIERAELEPGEDERIAADLARLEHADRLARIGAEVLGLTGAEGAAGVLAEAHKTLQEAVTVDATAAPLVARLGELAAEAAELAWDVRGWADGLESDPRRLEGLRERRALIASLKRKYGASTDDVIASGRAARRRIDELETADERAADVAAEVETVQAEVSKLASELSKRRRKAAKAMTKLVDAELPALALPNASFEVVCEDTGEPTESGADRIEFRFSSTRSRAPDAIGKIASGGELSRAMIAVTLALAQAHHVPVLVFDEADAGVGGEAALELARRLARLGRTHQVLVVSHLPQIAAFADRHVVVRRSEDDIDVEVLDAAGRLAEISRMLAGLESSEAARAHAAELVELAETERNVPVGAGASAPDQTR